MQNSQCVVFIYLQKSPMAVPAGLLRATGQEYIFQYGKKYLQRPDAQPLEEWRFPLSSRLINLGDNLGIIRDAAPDHWGRLVFEKTSSILNPGEIDYLLVPNAARTGNLDFRLHPTDGEPALNLPEAGELPSIIDAAEAIDAGTELSNEQRKAAALLRVGSSLGGARPKCAIRIGEELWLAKFPARGDKYSNARIEAATMTLAKQCGVSVPDMMVENISGREVFLIKRFDRESLFARVPYMSALTMLEITETDYTGFSYLDLAARIRQKSSVDDLRELFTRIAINIVIRNTDDHPRNHGFLHTDGVWHLAPVFDVTPTVSREGISSVARLAMKLGDFGHEASLDNLLSRVGEFDLTRDEGKAIFEQVADVITASWRAVFSEAGVSEEDGRLFEHTFTAFEDVKSCRYKDKETTEDGEEEPGDSWIAP